MPFRVRRAATELGIDDWATTVGHVFVTFDDQDSGCRSLGLAIRGTRWFVKHAPPGAAASLRRALRFHEAVRHPAIVAPQAALSTRDGLALVAPWVAGEVLYHPTRSHRPDRSAPASAHARFRAQPTEALAAALEWIFDAHLEVAARGFVAVDPYDGCFLYDFGGCMMRLCDLDEYRPGPFTVPGARLPGCTRFMAPEEFQTGATIDERTTAYGLGRSAQILLDRGDDTGIFRGPPGWATVAERATAAKRADRYGSVAEFVAAWRAVAT